MKTDNIIYVNVYKDTAILQFSKCNIETVAYIGKKGITLNKEEGDEKTPIGEFELGLVFGTKSEREIKHDINVKYKKINENLYWIDDFKSKYYNTLVDITKVEKDWKSAEHLIDYPIQYEYAIEIKINPQNISYKGSALFLHCKNMDYTKGCIAVESNIMKQIIENIDENTKIKIETK